MNAHTGTTGGTSERELKSPTVSSVSGSAEAGSAEAGSDEAGSDDTFQGQWNAKNTRVQREQKKKLAVKQIHEQTK